MPPSLESILGTDADIATTRLIGSAHNGHLPINADQLLNEPSGNLFGLTQDVGMGWNPKDLGKPEFLIVSTQGGLRAEDGTPVALGFHTGHWEIGLLVRAAAEALRGQDTVPFSVTVSDPCDGRTQGTVGMFDSLPYRNDAAITMRRLIRSLPTRVGVMGIATCDKGLPAMMLALAGCTDLPGIIVPGGVTLPGVEAEDAGTVQTIGARFAHDMITLDYAAEMGCRACGSAGGGCQFLGTAATAQVVAEAFGMSLPHSALCPSGEPIWLDMARRSALALIRLAAHKIKFGDIVTQKSLENAMLVHAAFGGSTNLLLHIPAIAHAAGLTLPTVHDWQRVSRAAPRLVDALPNGPRNHPTVQVFMAGGVPEVMLHLRDMGLLHTDVITATGETLDTVLDWWQASDRRRQVRARLASGGQINPDLVIMDADTAHREGLSSTVIFPTGNLAPEGAVVKATAIDRAGIDEHNVYYHRGPARVFTSERAAIRALKGQTQPPVKANDVVVLIGAGPLGTGMEETYQLTSALKYIPWGKTVPILTDARFSGVSTGACIGHIGPEALAGGPLGKLRDGDQIEVIIDRANLIGSVNIVETVDGADFNTRPVYPDLQPHPQLPDDTRLWAALQQASGGIWSGCVYDVDRIITVLQAGLKALEAEETQKEQQ
jgi:putative YjhG/YagF family dehydratase